MSGLPAVGNLRQELTDFFNLFFSPGVDDALADLESLRWRYLFQVYIYAKPRLGYTQHLRGFACRVISHFY